ncbi:MAG TPA: glyoxalase [Gammaproteobacteria bacterium]|nr:glyoxalase [Gammaproteobacteria bacterium]
MNLYRVALLYILLVNWQVKSGEAMAGIKDVLYVRFKVTDLQAQKQFLNDFGFQTQIEDDLLMARGTDSSPYIYLAEASDTPAFISVGFEAESEDALRDIAAIDGVPVETNALPGGGLIARLIDPNGFAVEVVTQIAHSPELPVAGRSGLNDGSTKQRLGQRVALDASACLIKRLGHVVLMVEDFPETFDWYQQRLGLLISDEIVMDQDGQEQTLGAFTRCNRGATFVDHHTLFFIHAGQADFNHAAFEVANWDVLMQSHYTLKKAGHQHSFGVGKHILGSQTFDYWKDPNGFMLEHFTDGDLFNESFGSHKRSPEELLGTLWGPEGMPGQ